ncbi:hypothetical protein [Ktedonosporobacter rubrisoli]|nr:hypothetical protein [Ktedonosporobacter rubrisoli]
MNCGLLSVILLVVVLAGVGSYFGYNRLKGSGTASRGGTRTGGNIVTDATSSSLKTTSLIGAQPLSVIYADVKITLIDVKQAHSFPDDSNTYQTDIMRIDFKEEQNTKKAPNYIYTDIMRLIFSNGTVVSPITAKNSGSPDISTTRQNWIDFPASTNLTTSNMVLRIGADTEQQMQIPLKPNADVSKYQPKTTTVNKQTQYSGVDWTLTNAVASWSADGNQAEKGMIYVEISLKMDNPSSSDFNADPGDYLRLKAGAVTAAPASTTIPLSIAQGQTGLTRNATFQVPQGSTDFALIFLPAPSVSGSQQVAIPFQIP